jgi:hypothetical protein
MRKKKPVSHLIFIKKLYAIYAQIISKIGEYKNNYNKVSFSRIQY